MFYSLALILAAHIIACAQESAPAPLAQCPALSVDCPTDISDGKSAPSTFSARLTGANPEAKLIFNWTVSSGVIETGQGTQTIKVIGAGDSLTATLEVQGLPQGCPNMFSCSMFSCPAPLARRFDSYGNLDFRDEKARLSNFALELSNSHSVQGYLIAYGIKADRQGKTQARLE
ncbi:MAG: hypothetical protein JO360_01055, partial [Acidobacteria bacterium]|nr:hypothetical protein [Acidobacteriota bacterium]